MSGHEEAARPEGGAAPDGPPAAPRTARIHATSMRARCRGSTARQAAFNRRLKGSVRLGRSPRDPGPGRAAVVTPVAQSRHRPPGPVQSRAENTRRTGTHPLSAHHTPMSPTVHSGTGSGAVALHSFSLPIAARAPAECPASMRPRRIRRGWASANALRWNMRLPFNEAPANSPGMGALHISSSGSAVPPSMRPRRIRRGWSGRMGQSSFRAPGPFNEAPANSPGMALNAAADALPVDALQ